MNKYFIIRDKSLYAYNTETKTTLCFKNNKWDISPLTKWVLEFSFILKEISEEKAMKLTNGIKPNEVIKEEKYL